MHCFEALDKSLHDIMRFSNEDGYRFPFGGRSGGDIRHIMPVIQGGIRQDVVNTSINASYFWPSVTVLRLTKNMRLCASNSKAETAEVQRFSDWVADIGDGKIGGANDGVADIELSKDIHLNFTGDLIAAIVTDTYPSSLTSLNDISYLKDRAILVPTLDVVDSILVPKPEKTTMYFNEDSTSDSNCVLDVLNVVHTPGYLKGLKCSSLPNHKLTLKVGTSVMLLMYIDHFNGLCNGTRLIIMPISKHVLEAEMLSGNNAGEKVLIPKMSLMPSGYQNLFQISTPSIPVDCFLCNDDQQESETIVVARRYFSKESRFFSQTTLCCRLQSEK